MAVSSKPIIHVNGTSAQTLFNQYLETRKALCAARCLLDNTAPHPRDYPSNLSDFQWALQEHNQRVSSLNRLILDMEALASHVDKIITPSLKS